MSSTNLVFHPDFTFFLSLMLHSEYGLETLDEITVNKVNTALIPPVSVSSSVHGTDETVCAKYRHGTDGYQPSKIQVQAFGSS